MTSPRDSVTPAVPVRRPTAHSSRSRRHGWGERPVAPVLRPRSGRGDGGTQMCHRRATGTETDVEVGRRGGTRRPGPVGVEVVGGSGLTSDEGRKWEVPGPSARPNPNPREPPSWVPPKVRARPTTDYEQDPRQGPSSVTSPLRPCHPDGNGTFVVTRKMVPFWPATDSLDTSL